MIREPCPPAMGDRLRFKWPQEIILAGMVKKIGRPMPQNSNDRSGDWSCTWYMRSAAMPESWDFAPHKEWVYGGSTPEEDALVGCLGTPLCLRVEKRLIMGWNRAPWGDERMFGLITSTPMGDIFVLGRKQKQVLSVYLNTVEVIAATIINRSSRIRR